MGNAEPIKQNPYRVNPKKLEFLKKELGYMLEHGIIEPSQSNWSSPCILVPKNDGSYRFCTDYRKVNSVTTSDSYSISRVEDCIDRIGCMKHVTKLDLLKGYWQVPITTAAKKILAFVTLEGFYQYKVMPFGMKNTPATFQHMINEIIRDLDSCEAYIDDVVVFESTWEEHLSRVEELLCQLRSVNLIVNLVKSELGYAYVTSLGHVVGQSQVRPVTAKVDVIISYPAPTTRRQMIRFFGYGWVLGNSVENLLPCVSHLPIFLKRMFPSFGVMNVREL